MTETKPMTVEDIISYLQNVKDKKTHVYIGVKGITIPIVSVTEEEGEFYAKVLFNVESAWSEDEELNHVWK